MKSTKRNKPEFRVLHVFSVLGIGGAEIWLIALLKYFNEMKYNLPVKLNFDICLTGGKKGELDEEAESLGARLFYLHYTRGNLLLFIHRFRQMLSKGHYNVIHDHQDYTAGMHLLMGLGYLPKVRLVHIHNPLIHIQNYSTSLLRRMTLLTGKKLLTQLPTHIMGTSRQVLIDYGIDNYSFSRQKCGAAYCGFDMNRFLRNPKSDHNDLCNEFSFQKEVKILLFVGRLESGTNRKVNQKNPEFAIEVAMKCIHKDPAIRMLMVGSGEDMRKKLEEQITVWGLEDKIRLLGARNDIPRLMSGSDILLLPSLAEGLGMVAVEAQAADLMVLASDTVPHECEVVPGLVKFMSLKAGFSDWADEVLRLIKLPHSNREGSNKLVKDSPFSIEKSANCLLDLYFGK